MFRTALGPNARLFASRAIRRLYLTEVTVELAEPPLSDITVTVDGAGLTFLTRLYLFVVVLKVIVP